MMKYKKPIIIAVVVLVIVILVIVFYPKSKTDKFIDGIEVESDQLTISESDAAIIAKNLLDAMNRWGTDENAIIENLLKLNKNDLLLVIKKFGVQPYSDGVLATSWIQKKLWSTDKNLVGWLRAELSGSTLDQVQQLFAINEVPF